MDLRDRAKNIRKNILDAGHACGVKGGHFGGSLSIADIMAVLYGKIMRYNINNPLDENRDRFILSKGHCAQALYATLYEFGFIAREQLLSFNANGADFPSHCVRKPALGIELSSGSLGLGLSFAIGEALGLNGKSNLYVMVGNGEMNEGSFWEAAMFAGHKKISSVCAIIDDNQMQLDGMSENIMPVFDWAEKLKSFGWTVAEIDGHDLGAIENAFKTERNGKPLAIVAKTIKGKGISFMENNPEWHHNKLNDEQYAVACEELERGL
jgi:transketolase